MNSGKLLLGVLAGVAAGATLEFYSLRIREQKHGENFQKK